LNQDEYTPRGLCYNTFTMPPRFFRIGLLIICAAICAAAGAPTALPGQTTGNSQGDPAETSPGTILVFPFENDSHMASLDWLGEGLGELTFERLQDRGQTVLSRQERLTALEKIGLPDSARFSHATMVKIAAEVDADEVVFGKYVSNGKMVTLEAQVMRINPPRLSAPYTQTSSMEELLRAHARLSWQILCALDRNECRQEGANNDESSFTDPPPSLRLDALENFIRGLTGSEDESRLRLLREAARLEPAWDRPPFELGQIYFGRRDCELALPWFSRVPPNRPNGPEAAFNTGVCHVLRHDGMRAEASFSGLLERARAADPAERLPELPEFHNNLGVARLYLGKWSDAAIEFERAATLDAEEPDYWVNLGIARLAGKQPFAAVNPLERARKIAPDDKDARALLIPTLESLGRGSDAAAIPAPPETGGRAGQPVMQDPASLTRLARVSRKFDRALLSFPGDAPARQPSTDTHKNPNSGEHR
jgi:tetratricopeptide (TPR) repeat protein/TolB-like protein